MRHPVLLHGFTGSGSSWEGVVDALASAGHAPVLVDLPGHGGAASPPPDADPTLADALATVECAGAWPADLVGYSMGGRLALHFALARPGAVRRLVLESASPGLEDARERAARSAADAGLAALIEGEGMERFVALWEALPLFASQSRLDPERLARQRARRLSHHPRALAGALRGLGTGALPSLWDRLPQMRIPTLLLAGGEDRKFVEIAKAMSALLPDARLEVVPGCGHAVHLERPDAWAEKVVRFLSAESEGDDPG